jgi:hypothetical protein
MTVDARQLTALIESELAKLSDDRVVAHIRAHLVEPTMVMRRWNYGPPDQRYACWTVLRHSSSNTGIAYCESGFGPRSPWGLVFLEGDEEHTSMGADCSWYTTFLQTFFDSGPATELPIWRAFKTDSEYRQREPLSDEGDWDETWAKVMALRESDPAGQYFCWTSVEYERE